MLGMVSCNLVTIQPNPVNIKFSPLCWLLPMQTASWEGEAKGAVAASGRGQWGRQAGRAHGAD